MRFTVGTSRSRWVVWQTVSGTETPMRDSGRMTQLRSAAEWKKHRRILLTLLRCTLQKKTVSGRGNGWRRELSSSNDFLNSTIRSAGFENCARILAAI